MTLDPLQDAQAIQDWLKSRAHAVFLREKDNLAKFYLSQSANNEYAAIVAANRCQALEDLTNALEAVISFPESTKDDSEAAAEPKSSTGRKPPIRSAPQTI